MLFGRWRAHAGGSWNNPQRRGLHLMPAAEDQVTKHKASDTGTDKRQALRDEKGQFETVVDTGKALDTDRPQEAKATAPTDVDDQASRGRSEYGQVGGTRELAEDEGGYSRDGRQGGFGEEQSAARSARKQNGSPKPEGRRGAVDPSRISNMSRKTE